MTTDKATKATADDGVTKAKGTTQQGQPGGDGAPQKAEKTMQVTTTEAFDSESGFFPEGSVREVSEGFYEQHKNRLEKGAKGDGAPVTPASTSSPRQTDYERPRGTGTSKAKGAK